MCFKNLPVEFDEQGNAYLREGVADPYAFQSASLEGQEDKLKELLARNGYIKNVDFDPVTRVAGALAFHTVVDLESRKVLSGNSMATLFRGYEIILRGRDPRDAAFISSRACGVCGGVHSTTAALAMEMALGLQPPPLGVVVRNMLLSIEYLYDHPLHLFLLAGPDYSEQIVSATTPSLWERAKKTEAKYTADHGYATVGALMTDMNPLTGKLYVEALHMTRVAREAYVLIGGKYPHPQTVVPGGMSVTVNIEVLNEFYQRLYQFFEYGKKVVAIWDEITEFFYEADPAYKQCGIREATMIDLGQWDHPDFYDTTYKNCDTWGKARWATPGVLVDGEIVTTNLQQINIGLEEFVEHSYYEEWHRNGQRFDTDPLGAPLSPNHPWNKETIPKPGRQSWRDRYSWDTSPTWDRQVMEAGAYARLYLTAKAQQLPETRFLQATGDALRIHIPGAGADGPDRTLDWRVPDAWNTFERNRARAYAIPYTAMVCMENWLRAQELLRQNKTEISRELVIPKKGTQIGVGFWGAGRGYLSHHLVIDDGAIGNYQIVTPSTINAAPRTPWGAPGPYEQAVMNTPILEEYDNPDEYKGIDVLRTIRSFDPCMPCTTHITVEGSDQLVTREVTTCACGVE